MQEFLREVFSKCVDSKELQEKSEEGFLFLTDRSTGLQLSLSLYFDFFIAIIVITTFTFTNGSWHRSFIKRDSLPTDLKCGEHRSQCT